MPDLIQLSNDLKTSPDQWLLREVQHPSGAVPPYLILAELQRRQLLRSGSAAKPPSSSVAQDTVRSTLEQITPPAPAGPPPPPGMAPPSTGTPSGAPGAPMPGAQPPQNMPQGMAAGGMFDDEEYDNSDEFDTGDGDTVDTMAAPTIPQMVNAAAVKHNVDPNLAAAVANTESNFRANAVSPKGAIGPMQLMPKTARDLGVNPHNPAQNIDAGMRLLSGLLRRFGGDKSRALAAYNAGPGAVQRYGGVPPFPETQSYVKKVLNDMEQRRQRSRSRIPWEQPDAALLADAGLDASPDADTTPAALPETLPDVTGPQFSSIGPQYSPMAMSRPPAAPSDAAAPTPAAPSAPAPGGLAVALPEQEALNAAKKQYEALNAQYEPYDPMSALSEKNLKTTKAAIETILGKRPDYGGLESAITLLQQQAEQALHPSISNVLLQLGLGILGSRSPYLGQAVGAGVGNLERQRKEARQNYIEALKAGVDLQSKKNAYDEKIGQLAMGQVREQQQAGVTADKAQQAAIAKAASDVARAQSDFNKAVAKAPEMQMQARKTEIDNYRAMSGATGPYTEEEQKYIQFGTKPSGARPTFNAYTVAAQQVNVDPTRIWTPEEAARVQAQYNKNWEGQHPTVALSPEARHQAALAYFNGQPLPPMPRGAASAKELSAIINEAAAIGAQAQIPMVAARASGQAAQKALNQRIPQLSAVRAFEGTALANLDIFTNAAKSMVDSGVPWINKPLRSLDLSGMGSDEQAAVNAARTVALTEIAKVVNNPTLTGVLSDSARHEVLGLIPEDATLAQIYKVVNILKQDMANRRGKLEGEIAELQQQLATPGGALHQTKTETPQTVTGPPPRPPAIAGAVAAEYSAKSKQWRYKMKESDPWTILKTP